MSEKTCIELAREARQLVAQGHLYEAAEKYEEAGDCSRCPSRGVFFYNKAATLFAIHHRGEHG